MEDGESGWEMPSESEMKIIQARRERSEKISSLMGEYLLKGYKMLSTTCNNCDTILLQDKRNNLYCVACEEIDCSESAKDEPALSESAARRQVEESQFSGMDSATRHDDRMMPSSIRFADTGTTQSTPSISNNQLNTHPTTFSSSNNNGCVTSTQGRDNNNLNIERNNDRNLAMETEFNQPDFSSITVIEEGNAISSSSYNNYKRALEEKMDWACKLLKSTTNVGKCIELVTLVKSCAEALGSLRDIESRYHNCNH